SAERRVAGRSLTIASGPDWKARPMNSRWLPLLFVVVACAANAASPAPSTPAAQTASSATPAAPAAPAAPEAVTQWAQQTLERIADIRVTLAAEWSLQEQQDAFDAAIGKYDAHFKRFVEHPAQIADLSDLALEDVTREINAVTNAVSSIDKAIGGRAVDLETQLRELSTLADRAKELRAGRGAGALPEALLTRLDRIVSEVEPLTATVRDRLNEVATLQNRILTTNERIDVLRQGVAQVNAGRLREMLRFEQTPLWQITEGALAVTARNSTEF